MAELIVTGSSLTVRLSALEKVAAFRGDVTVSLKAIRSVSVESQPFASLRGIRAPGTGIPGVISYGQRRHRGGRDFAAVVAGKPAVRIDLDPALSKFGRLCVSVADPDGAVQQISAAAGL